MISGPGYSETDDEDVELTRVDVDKSKVKIDSVPEFQFVIDPPSPVHEDETRRSSGESKGKREDFIERS